MLRRLYAALVQLHPARFRERFGGEMMEVFRYAAGPVAIFQLFADCLLSLFRQWAFRW